MKLLPARSRRPEIQMAPLIDCVFLLLMFYAVTTQFVTDQRLKLELPEARTAEQAGNDREQAPPEVLVASDGTVWIDQKLVSEAELEARIRALVEQSTDRQIILRGDKVADYGVVVKVLDTARAVGAKGVQMSAERPPQE